MKYLSVLLLLVFSLARSHELSDQKYDLGDCITPIQENWSWYKEYAVVDDFGTSMKGPMVPRFILWYFLIESVQAVLSIKIRLINTQPRYLGNTALYQKSKMS